MATWSSQEEKYFKRIKKVFHSEYETGTLGIVECDDSKKREQVFEHITAELPQLKHVRLDASQKQVKSLELFLKRHVSTEASKRQPISYMIHVTGLENSLYLFEGKRRVESTLLKQINVERETLWQFPFHIMIWGDHFLIRKMQQEAVDFWSWVTHYYRFEVERPGILPAAGIFQKLMFDQMSLKEYDRRILVYNEFLKDLESQHRGRWTDQALESKINALLLLGNVLSVKRHFGQAVEMYQRADQVIADFKKPDSILVWKVKKALVSGLLRNDSVDQASFFLDQLAEELNRKFSDEKWLVLQLLKIKYLNLKGDHKEATDIFQSTIKAASDLFLEIDNETLTDLLVTAIEAKLHEEVKSIGTSLQEQGIDSSSLKHLMLFNQSAQYSDEQHFNKSLDLLLGTLGNESDVLPEIYRVLLEVQVLRNYHSIGDVNSYIHWFETFSADWLERGSEAYHVLFDELRNARGFIDEEYFFEQVQIALGFAVEFGHIDFLTRYVTATASGLLAKLPDEESHVFIKTSIHLLKEAGGTEEAAELQARLDARLKEIEPD